MKPPESYIGDRTKIFYVDINCLPFRMRRISSSNISAWQLLINSKYQPSILQRAVSSLGPKLTLDQTTVDSGTKGRKVRLTFDPLGTAAPMTVKAKIKLRGLGVKGLSYRHRCQHLVVSVFRGNRKAQRIEFTRCLFLLKKTISYGWSCPLLQMRRRILVLSYASHKLSIRMTEY
jgi:hypothetical protein